MKYIGMPFAIWQFFCASFEKNLPVFFGMAKADARSTMAKAKEKYKEIIGNLHIRQAGLAAHPKAAGGKEAKP